MTLTLTFDLEKFTQGQNFWNINWGKLATICLDIMHRASSIVGEVKGQGQGRAKGQIHLISYNFVSNCHRDFKLGSCFSLWKAAPNMNLTLTFDLDLEKFNQGQNFLKHIK